MPTYYTYHDSPIGQLLLAGDKTALTLISFPSGKTHRTHAADWTEDRQIFEQACQQLDEYFAGRRTTFELTLQPNGTAFQQQVWQALQHIPYGATLSYGELAKRIKRPKASRAVGAANGANPLPIVIPCHRVIGANGSLTGFGGGVATKEWLLAHEQSVCTQAYFG